MSAVVIVIRGCPVGCLGAYGNEWVATPNIDRVAAEGVLFDRHISDRPDSAAACAAWLGGADAPVLAALRARAVRTVLVRANHPDTDGPEWFYAGWGEVFDVRPQEEDKSPLDALIRELPALLDRLAPTPPFLLWIEIDRLIPPWDVRQDVFEAYLDVDELDASEPPESDKIEEVEAEEDEELETDSDEPVSELIPKPQPAVPDEPVTPWFDPPTGPFDTTDSDAWEWLHSTYAALVTSLDAELGWVFDQLRERGLDQSAAWLITSDFGYPLGEHGQIGLHRPWLHEELVHIPLILRLPGEREACRRVAGITQPPDLAPTLLDVFGVKPAEATSLLALARGEGESKLRAAVTVLELNGAAELALRTAEWALLVPVWLPEGETREPLLFAKPDDRWEVNDVRQHNIERVNELEAELKARR